MMSGSALAVFMASAVSSRWARLRATSAIEEKSRARRIAVERPMPWLAPVTIATEFDMSSSLAGQRGEEVPDCRGDLLGVRLQREMAGIEETDDRAGNVALERLGAGRQEEGVVLAPSRQQRRLVPAEVVLESRVERDIALVV